MWWIERQGHDGTLPIFCHKSIVYADAKSGRDHGIGSVVVTGREADIRGELVGVQQSLQIGVLLGQNLDERAVIQ